MRPQLRWELPVCGEPGKKGDVMSAQTAKKEGKMRIRAFPVSSSVHVHKHYT